jgi:eukaryotic-like serine/threonine-protein kinase
MTSIMTTTPDVYATPKLSEMNYRVVNQLGTGAGSTIFQISDKADKGKRYALKVVKRQGPDDDIYIAQARTEYDVAQRLHHHAIVKIHDIRLRRNWFKVSGVELLMEYIDGRTLDELEGPGRRQLVLIFHQAADALSHMHRRGVYHGDLKPSNIMISKEGQVKLIDFGTAWIRGEEKNRVQGTPQYMAPEQAADRLVDERTDMYNFGATMYRMFTGRFAQTAIPNPKYPRPLTPPIEVNPKIPGTLNETILRCLEVDRDARPAGMFEVKHQLAAVAKYLRAKPADLKKGLTEDE